MTWVKSTLERQLSEINDLGCCILECSQATGKNLAFSLPYSTDVSGKTDISA